MLQNFSYLIDTYKESKNDQNLFIDTQSIHWDNHYKNNEKFLDKKNLINFRKNQILSDGMDDAMFVQNNLSLIEVLENFESEFLKENLPIKNVGNCNYAINFLGYYFDYGIIHHLKWYQKIKNFINEKNYVLEIGGGFGSLARIIINNKDTKYFILDLPEANLISNYYLQNHFPNKKIFNYSDFKKFQINKEINNYDIFILPPRTLDNIQIKFDFIINTRSFMEMNKKIIKEYFALIHDKIKLNGYFLNINRYKKSTVGEEIKFENYPYDSSWNAIISEKSFLQDHIHFLLSKKIDRKGNISEELKKISTYNSSGSYGNYEFFFNLKIKIKTILFKVIKKILLFLFKKDLIKKISKILYNISSNKN